MIALVELHAVVCLIAAHFGLYLGRDAVWFIDNSVAGGFMQEQSANADIDAGASCAQLMLAHLNARCWLKYVESDLSWVDGASRAPDAGPFLKSGVSHSMAHSPDLAVDGLALPANSSCSRDSMRVAGLSPSNQKSNWADCASRSSKLIRS